jgi:hypothetical protein
MTLQLLEDLTFTSAAAFKLIEPSGTNATEEWDFNVPIRLDAIINGIRYLKAFKPGESHKRLANELANDPTQYAILNRLRIAERVFVDFDIRDAQIANLRIAVFQMWRYYGDHEGLQWVVNNDFLRSLESSRLATAKKGTWEVVYTSVAENEISQSVVAVVVAERILGSGTAKSGRKVSSTVDAVLEHVLSQKPAREITSTSTRETVTQ